MKKVLLEAALVALVGAALAFVANAISPRGLKLTRDYFPGAVQHLPAPVAGTNAPSPQALVAARLQAKGLQLAEHSQVLQLFHDPRYEQELVIFIDARPEEDQHGYEEGHIPGAYHFDHYHFEKYLPTLLPLCQAAQQIVVYCNGGDCTDSESAAIYLRDGGIPKEKLLVYGGGITEWKSNGLPLEIGARKSGNVQLPHQTK